MLTKCCNPPCSASFRSLEEGRLFRVEPDPAYRTDKSEWAEYYWLCQHCASTMTLRLGDHADVIAVAIPSPLLGVPGIVTVTQADRKGGLLLKEVHSQLAKHCGKRIRMRSNRHDVA